MLKANAGLNLGRQVMTRLKEDSAVLRDVAMRFSMTSLRVDLLSVYETKVSKVRDSRFLQKYKKMVVSRY